MSAEMTNPIDLDALEALLAKATRGPWEVDNEYDNDALYSGGGGCGRGFKNFFIGADVGGKWKTLLDTQNSDHKLIEEDYDDDGKSSWDEIGWANTAAIVALHNAAPALIATARKAERLEKVLAYSLHEMRRAFADPDSLKKSEMAMNSFCEAMQAIRAALGEQP